MCWMHSTKWPPRADVAEPEAASAFVAHDHEGCRAFTPALADVGAGGLFAYCHQLLGAQDVFYLSNAPQRHRRLDANPVWFW